MEVNMYRYISILLSLILILYNISTAQLSTSTIQGKVVDSEGKVVRDAAVLAKNLETGTLRGVTTSKDGRYTILSILPGKYEISVQHVAYRTEKKQVEVFLGQTLTVDFKLSPKEIELGQIVVVSQSEAAALKNSELSTIMKPEQVVKLPLNTRNFLELATLAPGIKPIGSTIGSGAQQPTAMGFYIDGAEYKNEIVEGGLAGQFLSSGNAFPQEAIREFKVITQMYKAEYAKATAGIISAVTKTGTNEFHGSAFLTYRDKSLNARGPFELTKPAYKRRQTGLSLSGPIIRDKMHFFTTYEGEFRDGYTTVVPANLSQWGQFYGTYHIPFKEHLGVARLTYQLSENHFFDFTFNGRYDRSILGVGGTNAYERGRYFDNSVYTFGLKHQYSISNNMFNELRINFQTYNWKISNIAPEGKPGMVYPSIAFGNFSHAPQNWFQDRYALYNDFTYVLNEHTLKAGLFIQRLKYQAEQKLYLNPQFYFKTDTSSEPYYAIIGSGNPNVTKWNTQFGFYIQDDWNVNDQLTLNLGLRWDYESNMINNDFVTPDSIRRDLSTFFPSKYFSDGSNRKPYLYAFAPRLGFSYDIFKDKKTILFGGAGIFYDRHVWNVASDEIIRLTWKVTYIYFPQSNDPTAIPWNNAYYNRDALLDLVNRGKTPPPEIFLIPEDLKPPKTLQFSLGIRQQLGQFTLGLSYAGVRGYNEITTYNANYKSKLTTKYGRINVWTDEGNSWYDALYVTIDKPYKPGSYGFSIAYTLSKTSAEFDNTIYYGYNYYTSPDFLTKAPSTLDERHRISINAIVDLPWGFLLSGWGTFATGRPYLVYLGTDANNDGVLANDYPPEGRNAGREPLYPFIFKHVFAYRNVNLRLSKMFSYRGYNLELMLDVFNVFNWTNFGGYVGRMNLPTFGNPTTAGAPRQIQLGTRLSF